MYRQNQLARNNQVQAARQRLGMIPGGADQGNLAGCGGQSYPPGAMWQPYLASSNNIPQTAPNLPPGSVVNPGMAVIQNLAPLSAIVQATDPASPTTFELSCRQYFYGSGISSCNECFSILLNSFLVGGTDYNLLGCGPVDVGIWNTDACYCPWDIGCISTLSPATLTFTPFNTPSVLPFLNLVVWGTAVNDVRGCGMLPPWFGPNGGNGGGGMGGNLGPQNLGVPGGNSGGWVG
jgi:hypothetical protein